MHRLTALLVLLFALIATPAAAQKCATGTPKKPLLGTEVFQIPGPSGNVGQFREAYINAFCGSDPFKHGLADASGKVLVPAEFYEVIPINATSAAVLDIDRRMLSGNQLRYRLYVFGKGLQKPVLPWPRIFSYNATGLRTPYAYFPGSNEVALILGDIARPVTIRNLGGKGWPAGADQLYQANDTLIANFTAPDGTPLSRVLSMRGEPISPAIGAIERWETLSPETARDLWRWRPRGRYHYPTIGVDYVSAVLAGDHAVLPYGKLYLPIAANGDPLPMPKDAIGVFPLKFDTHAWAGSTTQGWAIVEETAQGLRVRPGIGTLQSVLARAATLPAYTGLSRYIDRSTTYDHQVWVDVFAARQPGESAWRFIDAQTLARYGGDGADSTGSNPSDAVASFRAYRIAAVANRKAEHERERVAAWNKAMAERDALHSVVLAGDFCNWYRPGNSQILAVRTIDHILANCSIQNDAFFNYARSLGANPDLLARAEYKHWEARGRYAIPIPPAPADIYAKPNWAAWGDSIVKSARESTDTFVRDNRRQYYSNMEKWNRGKQNWCC